MMTGPDYRLAERLRCFFELLRARLRRLRLNQRLQLGRARLQRILMRGPRETRRPGMMSLPVTGSRNGLAPARLLGESETSRAARAIKLRAV